MTERKRISFRTLAELGVVGLMIAAACGMSGGSSSPGGEGPAGASTGNGTGAGGTGTNGSGVGIPASTGAAGTTGAGGAGGGTDNLPPEKMVDSSYKTPIATGHFVWIVNPTSGRVAYVDASSLAVQTVEAGNAPTYIAAVPGVEDAVVVLNTLSNDATFLSSNGTTLTSRTIEGVAPGSNAWAVSPDGHYAIAWTDSSQLPPAPDTQGYQNVTILDLQAAPTATAATTLAVGYRPVSVSFSADSSKAFAVTQDGVSVVALAQGAVVDTVPLGANGVTDPEDTHGVSITPDGRLAVVRRDASDIVAVVDLASHARTEIPLSGVVTDVEVSTDGARAVAVVRATAEVAILPLAGQAPAPADVVHVTITGETVGQVTLTADGTVAVLYTNAVATDRISVLTLGATPAFHVVRLHAPVLSALPTPDGKFAVVLHSDDLPSAPDAGADADGGADAAAPPPPPTTTVAPPATAFSLAPLDGTQPPRIQAADAPIQAVAISPGSNRVLLTERDDTNQIFGAYLGLMPTLEVMSYTMASPPIATGVVSGANAGYVAQDYSDGRITFLSLDSGDARTLTGYELGARVVQWSAP
jgi:hypothetical protein